MRQFQIHIARPKSVMALTSMKRLKGESLKDFLTRFNAVVASVDQHDPSMVLMAAVLGIANNLDFKISLERDPSMDFEEFYHETERFLRQEDAKADRDGREEAEVYAIRGGGPAKKDSNKDKEKRKTKDNSDGSKRLRRKPRFTSYTELTETLE